MPNHEAVMHPVIGQSIGDYKSAEMTFIIALHATIIISYSPDSAALLDRLGTTLLHSSMIVQNTASPMHGVALYATIIAPYAYNSAALLTGWAQSLSAGLPGRCGKQRW